MTHANSSDGFVNPEVTLALKSIYGYVAVGLIPVISFFGHLFGMMLLYFAKIARNAELFGGIVGYFSGLVFSIYLFGHMNLENNQPIYKYDDIELRDPKIAMIMSVVANVVTLASTGTGIKIGEALNYAYRAQTCKKPNSRISDDIELQSLQSSSLITNPHASSRCTNNNIA